MATPIFCVAWVDGMARMTNSNKCVHSPTCLPERMPSPSNAAQTRRTDGPRNELANPWWKNGMRRCILSPSYFCTLSSHISNSSGAPDIPRACSTLICGCEGAISCHKDESALIYDLCVPFRQDPLIRNGSPDALEFLHIFTLSHYHTTISSFRKLKWLTNMFSYFIYRISDPVCTV